MGFTERGKHSIRTPYRIRDEARRLHPPVGSAPVEKRIAQSPEHSRKWADHLNSIQKFRFFMLTSVWPGSHTKAATEMHLKSRLDQLPASGTIFDRRADRIRRAAEMGNLMVNTAKIK